MSPRNVLQQNKHPAGRSQPLPPTRHSHTSAYCLYVKLRILPLSVEKIDSAPGISPSPFPDTPFPSPPA